MVDTSIGPPTAAEFATLADSIEHLNDRLRISERRSKGLIVALLVLAAVTAIVVYLLIVGIQARSQLQQSIHEQCSLYGLIVPSYSDAAKARSPLGPDAYTNAYRRMQVSADNLHCGIPHKVPGT